MQFYTVNKSTLLRHCLVNHKKKRKMNYHVIPFKLISAIVLELFIKKQSLKRCIYLKDGGKNVF